jgi:hypothetical protein
MKKRCADNQCRRKGRRMPLTEFPINRRASTGRHSYCYECAARRMKDTRRRAREAKAELLKHDLERKQNVLAEAADPFVKVYWAIVDGCKTRQELHAKTHLNYGAIGDALAELVFDCKVVRIVNREFVLVESELVRAA